MTTKTNNKYTGIRKEYQEYLHFSSKSSPEDEGRFNWKNSRRERSRLNRSLFLTLFLYFSKWFESWLKTLKCIIITIIIKEQGLGRISREIREWKQSVIIFTRSASRSTIFYHFQDGKRKWKSRKLRREEKGWYERERERKSTPIKWEWVWLLVQEDLREKYKSSPVQVMMRESDSHDGKQGDCPLKNRVMMEETDTHSLTSYLLTLTPSVKISLPLKRERRKRERERVDQKQEKIHERSSRVRRETKEDWLEIKRHSCGRRIWREKWVRLDFSLIWSSGEQTSLSRRDNSDWHKFWRALF